MSDTAYKRLLRMKQGELRTDVYSMWPLETQIEQLQCDRLAVVSDYLNERRAHDDELEKASELLQSVLPGGYLQLKASIQVMLIDVGLSDEDAWRIQILVP